MYNCLMFYSFAVLLLFFVSLPLQAVVSILIWSTSGIPLFFTQKRIGKVGKPFTMYKFRTMRAGAEKEQRNFRRRNESDGPVFKIHNDPRYTKVGKFLAHTGLDELPQLLNVLRGDMALFGPRSLPVSEAAKLKSWQQKRHDIKPGILSPAILTGKYHEDFNAWMKSDVAYVKNKSFMYDLRLAWQTLKFLINLFLQELAFRC